METLNTARLDMNISSNYSDEEGEDNDNQINLNVKEFKCKVCTADIPTKTKKFKCEECEDIVCETCSKETLTEDTDWFMCFDCQQ